ncbi:MAG: ATP-binding protein [Bdellovibrionales bacterium]
MLLLGLFLISRAEENEWLQMKQLLHIKARLVQESIKGRSPNDLASLQKNIRDLEKDMEVNITLLNHEGAILADSGSVQEGGQGAGDQPELQRAHSEGQAMLTRYSPRHHGAMTYFALRTQGKTDAVEFIRVATPATVVQQRIASLKTQVWTSMGITGLVGLVLAYWFTRRIVKPLEHLAEGAERIAAGEYGRKVMADGQDEVGKLARSFNYTSERLAMQFAQLDEDRQQLRAVLSSMEEGVIAVDAEQRIQFANQRAGHYLSFDVRAVVGRRLWEIIRHRHIQELVKSALTDALSHHQELDWTGPNARTFIVHASPLPGIPPRGAVLVFHDTTELRRLERIRQDFVANVSHELKTPLTVIKANVETLLDGAAEDANHRDRFLKRIADHADRLNNLIHDLLSLARIESGSGTYVFKTIEVEEVVNACLQNYLPLAESKKQTLEVVAPPEPWTLWADEEAIFQILGNLVENAIKYTPEHGKITVRWWGSEKQVMLEVRDTGVGIPEHELARIFERFYRVDKARSRQLGGTGLGLSIVKHLTQALNGSVTAESIYGKGSVFLVGLPRPG